MKYCKKCVMPDTRPGIYFDERGICSGCISEEKKDSIDWDLRFRRLQSLCEEYRGSNGDFYDCIIAVSGGKDSHFQVHVMKELMGMHPLLVTVEDNFTMTEAGKHNIKNISEEFSCDIVSLKPNIKTQKIIMRHCFEQYAKPTYFTDRLIYTYPIWMAIKLRIPLVVYGENTSYEYGGPLREETYSAKEQINNRAVNKIATAVNMNAARTATIIRGKANSKLIDKAAKEKVKDMSMTTFQKWRKPVIKYGTYLATADFIWQWYNQPG